MERQLEKFNPLLNLLGNVSGIIALLTVVFYGGALVSQVKSLDMRLGVIEAFGAPPVREHIKLDDVRDNIVMGRIAKVEASIITVPSELARINTKLDMMKEKLDKMP